MNSSYQLYGRQNSGSFAVQVALEEAGAPYERIWISKEPGDAERLKRVNPAGKVPALVLPDGTVMMESAAMLIHVAAVHPQANLAPRPGTTGHAMFLQWMVFLSANVYEAALRIYYSERYSARGSADAEAVKAQAAADFLAHLHIHSARLGPFLLGDRYTIADTYLYMLAGWWPEGLPELFQRVPRLQPLCEAVAARPAVIRVEADHATG